MEKLIELIGEWQKETHPDGIYLPVVAYRDGIFWSDSDCLSSVMDEIHLISKPCGFIGWLVENDNVRIPHELDELPAMYGYDYDSAECKADRLLMLLSISDTPIEDLLLYLK